MVSCLMADFGICFAESSVSTPAKNYERSGEVLCVPRKVKLFDKMKLLRPCGHIKLDGG
jgi:hypothetical protein